MSLEAYDLNYNILAVLDDPSPDAAHHIVLTENLNGVDILRFELPMNSTKWQWLINENLVKYKGQYYFVKLPTFIDSTSEQSVTIECKHTSSSLQNQLNGTLTLTAKHAQDVLQAIITERVFGWTLNTIDIDFNPLILRDFTTKDQSVFTNLVKAAEIFEGFLLFDSSTNQIRFKKSLPDRDIILTTGVNLKSVNLGYDTSQIVTRMYPFGAKDAVGQDVNITSVTVGNVPYVDDFSYFLTQGYTQPYIDAHPELFMHEMIWRQPTYYSATDLFNDATSRLAIISQPIVNVSLNALDLSSLPQFFALSPILGELITIIDPNLNLNVQAQVVSIQRSSESPIALNVQISNEIVYNSILQSLVRSDKLVNTVGNEPTGENSGYHIQAKTVTADKIKVGTGQTLALYARGASTNTTPNTRYMTLDAISIPVSATNEGFTVVVINRADYNIDSTTLYDTFNVPADITAMTSALNALSSGKIVVILSEGRNAVSAALITALERCGASAITKAYMDSNPSTPYALVGIPTIGKGQGHEVLTGPTASDPPAIISTFLVDGTPQTINSGFTQTTVIDGGQITTGTLDANVVNVTNLNADNIVTGVLQGIRIQQVTGSTVLADMFKDTNGGVLFIYDNGGLQNVKIGSEAGTGDNVGGTLILYNDGSADADKRVAAGISTSDDSGVFALMDSGGDERIFMNARDTTPFIGILDASDVFQTVLTDTYIDADELRENGTDISTIYFPFTGGTITGPTTMEDDLTLETELVFNNVLGAANVLMDLQQSYSLYSDNAGAGGNNTRVWLDTPNNGEVIIGPRAGANFLGQTRIRSRIHRIEAGTGSGRYIICDASFTGGSGTEPVIRPSSNNFGSLGNTTVSWWRGYANSWVNTSKREDKTTITDQDAQVSYDTIKSGIPIFHYQMKREVEEMGQENAPYYVGTIVDSCCPEIVDNGGSGVNLYTMISLLVSANQKLIADKESLETRVTILEQGGGTDLEQRVTDLENENADLKARLDALESKIWW